MQRREFVRLLAIAAAAAAANGCTGRLRRGETGLYDVPEFGNARMLHFTDSHAQLLPGHYREPSVNLGLADAYGKAPHLVGQAMLDYASLIPGSIEAHAFTYLDFSEAAERYGKIGGFAHLSTLIKQLRAQSGENNTLLLDGGDTWQGSGTAYWTRGRDMVGACNLLGVDIMTGHWEFTYQDSQVMENIEAFNGEFLAQNIRLTEDALFDDKPAFDADSGHAFKPFTVRSLGDRRIAVIGQAFPYTPIANPKRFVPDWTFGIRADDLQALVKNIRSNHKPDALILLSHNGMDVDLKLASEVTGIDAILGGHTHDGMPLPAVVRNPRGQTIVTNAGCNGKFLGVLDLDIGESGVLDFRYRLLPVFSNLLQADAEMAAYIEGIRKPYLEKLNEPLATAGALLYRRGNFNGSFDQVICDALRSVGDAEISLSPGFRWGGSVLPGETITMEQVLNQTCITYPETYVRDMSGEQLKLILEDIGDNLFNPDPYYQQGGDMVRLGGMNYVCEPGAGAGKRISDMTLDNGSPIEAGKSYRVAGWATVNEPAPGAPIWDVVAEYLRDKGTVKPGKLNTPILKGVESNPGLADYPV
jgi:sulfur-oxidizing protein SoxB